MSAPQTFKTLGPKCSVVDTPWGKSVVADEDVAADTPLYAFPGDIIDHPTMHTVQLDDKRHIDGHTGGPEYTSHACDPNAYFRFSPNDRVELVSIKPIKAGDHVTFHYCTTEWDMAEKFQCVCKSPLCVGAVRGFRHLSAADRERLAPYISPFIRKMRDTQSDASTSSVWSNFTPADGVPGLLVRTTTPGNAEGVEVMLEQWEAGSSEPPHSHPGDDMTVVVEGRMVVQFYKRASASPAAGDNNDADGALVKDGEPLELNKGDTGYVAANRIHDAKYIDACKLVYVHSKAFGFVKA